MSAYVVVEVDVHDPEGFAPYRDLAPPTIAQYGGRYLARGGKTETLESDWRPPRFTILEFENMDQVRAWWSSPEYADAKRLRNATTTTRMVAVEGLPPGWTP